MPYPAHAVLGFLGQFANSQQLAGAQHYYNRYRDYDVNTGRYIQADPIGLAGDDNPYAYAGGNPLRYMDPSGEVAWFIPIAVDIGAGMAFDYGLSKYKQKQCGCGKTAFGQIGNAALGAAIGATAGGVPKPRTGIAGGGKSGNWTSAASTLNHALARRGLYSTPIRHALTKGLKRVPYLGTALSAFELYDAIACK